VSDVTETRPQFSDIESYAWLWERIMSEPLQNTRILIIDDDAKLCRLVASYLQPLGYSVAAEHTGPAGLNRALDESFDAVLLDVMLPGLSGLDVLRELRKESSVPVLMLTALGEESDRIVGLEIGADDYLPKTFSTRELLARLRAVLRRSTLTARSKEPPKAAPIVLGDLWIDTETHRVVLNENPVTLTPVEYELLIALASVAGRVRTREQLLLEVAEREFEVFDRAIDVHISSLRRKLGDDPRSPRFIETVRGTGYRMLKPSLAMMPTAAAGESPVRPK
jgi:DNA-binding response OmpR family regulator